MNAHIKFPLMDNFVENRRTFMVCVLLGVLIGIEPPLLPAQQNQNAQKSNPEIETLKQWVSELEKKLQTVENIEKLDLQAKLAEAKAKLADANTKLINAEFGKFERELRDSNDEWLLRWGIFILAIVSVVGLAFWFALKSLITHGVEKKLDGFKEGLEEVGTLKNEIGAIKKQQRVLEKEYTAATVEDCIGYTLWYLDNHPDQIKGLGEEALLDVFDDKGRIQAIRYKAAEVLVARRSPRLIPPILELLNSVLDSNDDFGFETGHTLRNFIRFLGGMYTPEAYDGLRKLLNRMIEASAIHKEAFLMVTVLAFGRVGIELNMRDSVPILKSAMHHFQHPGYKDLDTLVGYFDRFNDSEGIKEILTNHITSGMPEVEKKCLDLLEKYDPRFVEEWRARKAADESEA